MIDSIKTLVNGLKLWVIEKIKNSDYDMNDPTNDSYIKNRPFYDMNVEKTYYGEAKESSYGPRYICIGEPPIVGETYKITCEGETVESIATKVEGDDSYIYLFHPDNTTQTTTRKVILYDINSSDYSHYTWFSGSKAVIYISGPFRKLKKLDSKFIDGVTSVNGEIGDLEITPISIGAAEVDDRVSIPVLKQITHGTAVEESYQHAIPVRSSSVYPYVCVSNNVCYVGTTGNQNKDYLTAYFYSKLEGSNETRPVIRHIAEPRLDFDAVNLGYLNTELNKKMTVPSAAEVGQTIVVKSVDSDGKPTEWEAVGLSDLLSSTTADNGKVLSVVNGDPSWTITSSEQAAISAANAEQSATIAQECAQAMAGTFDFTGYLRYQVVDAVPETYENGVLYLVTTS